MKITKTHIYITIGVLLLLVALGFYVFHQGKKTVTIQSLPGDLPGNPGSGTVTGASNDQLKLIANGLYTDMNGFNYGGHDYAPYNEAAVLSDNDLVKLYNTFNTLYQVSSGATLKEWIMSENFYYSDVPQTILARFAKLNLI